MDTNPNESFNRLHPECRDGEIWLCNVDKRFPSSLDGIRYGNVAYDANGNIINWMNPMFVSKIQKDDVQRFKGYHLGYYGLKT